MPYWFATLPRNPIFVVKTRCTFSVIFQSSEHKRCCSVLLNVQRCYKAKRFPAVSNQTKTCRPFPYVSGKSRQVFVHHSMRCMEIRISNIRLAFPVCQMEYVPTISWKIFTTFLRSSTNFGSLLSLLRGRRTGTIVLISAGLALITTTRSPRKIASSMS